MTNPHHHSRKRRKAGIPFAVEGRKELVNVGKTELDDNIQARVLGAQPMIRKWAGGTGEGSWSN